MQNRREFRREAAARTSFGALLIWTSISCADAGDKSQSPLPPVRPPSPSSESPRGGEAPPARSSTEAPSPAQPSDAAACLAQLRTGHVEAEIVPAPPAPSSGCGIAAPVRLISIGLPNGAAIDLPDRPIVECAFGVTFTEFVRDLMAPLAAATLGSPVVAVAAGGYRCATIDQLPGGKTSPHGKGIAIDMAEITLADRRRVAIGRLTKPETNPAEVLFLQTMRRAGCGWFTTVLGPGSDAAHADHFHLDIARHGASDNYRICE